MKIAFSTLLLFLFVIFATCAANNERQCADDGDESSGECDAAADGEEENFDGVDGRLCSDSNASCPQWAKSGECTTNPSYMLTHCRRSCGECKPTEQPLTELNFGVAQEVQGKDAAATREVIQRSVEYMREVVDSDVKYSSVRDICRNEHKLCSWWAAIEGCEENPNYMKLKCAPACRSCDMLDMKLRCPMDPDAVGALKPGDLDEIFQQISEGSEFAKFKPTVLSRPHRPVGKSAEGGHQEDHQKDGPWVVMFDEFLSREEVDVLKQWGHKMGYERSLAGDQVIQARNSENTWCREPCHNDTVVLRVLERISNVTGVHEDNFEHLQLLRYEEGQYYRRHHDFLAHQTERPCGPRILTFFLYLSDVEGGGTRFPRLGLTVEPSAGKAVLWPDVLNDDPNAKDDRTEHEALPVKSGIKYGANAWIHLYDFQHVHQMDCHHV